MNQLSDITSLVHRVKKKDVNAMRSLYDRYSKRMLATSFRITNDLQESEDIIQEAFLNSFQKIDQLMESAKYEGWVKRMVVNRSLTLVKKRIRFQEVELTVDPIDDTTDWYKEISFEVIKRAIQGLPQGCRQVFSLFLLENYKHQEIAELLNISVSTSKSQYRYALKLMREKLKKIAP